MYWIFLVLFIIAVLVPDIIRSDWDLLTETRVEEISIFIIGAIAFLTFMRHERLILFHKKEKEKDQKKINQTVRDLVESYSYIGEVNRKMDILMNIALGLTDKSILDKKREKEIYMSIVSAANFLMKADRTSLVFVDIKTNETKKHLSSGKDREPLKEKEIIKNEPNTDIKKHEDYLTISSPQVINNMKSFLIIKAYDDEEEKNPKNLEILKLFVSQALFLYSYTHQEENKNCPC